MSSIVGDYSDYDMGYYDCSEVFMAMNLRVIAEAMKIAMIKTWADLKVTILREKMR